MDTAPTEQLTPRVLANAIRFLAVDAVQKANSGHPGMPMGMADIAEALWRHHLRHNPNDPSWPNRDRFVLSNGHGSMLLYALLYLTGYNLPLAELENFRQLHSKTPGHPEHGLTPGVETTTGPLGQGLAMSVGMALAEQQLALAFNREGHKIVDHRTFVFCGDGCLMEGVSHEACSLAGSQKLEKLIVFYDDNGISIDGHVKDWFDDDTPKRFEAYGWRVIPNVDGHNAAALMAAMKEATTPCGKPTIVCCKTTIAYGAPHAAGTHESHGAALGKDEVAATREALHWPYPAFQIPPEIHQAWDARAVGAQRQAEWEAEFAAYAKAYPDLAEEFRRRMSGALPADFKAKADAAMEEANAIKDAIATRKASQNAIGLFAKFLPEFFGGSADLTGSNLTNWKETVSITHGSAGNYIHYGVREFGMSAALNGIALHGGYIPFGGTFLVFSDYARNAIRLSSLMGLRVIYVLTHDSIGLGEDGPTHQPIEHTASLRLIPNLDVWRPGDMLETFVAWRHALERTDGPAALALSRQNLPQHGGGAARAALIEKGGYVLSDPDGKPDLILIATGSEVMLATGAVDLLAAKGIKARVVSMPCTELFDRQDKAYRDSVLLPGVRRVAIEAGTTMGWYKYVGLDGAVVGLDRFGESAPGGAVMKYFGFTAEHVAEVAAAL
jgi:transketolase